MQCNASSTTYDLEEAEDHGWCRSDVRYDINAGQIYIVAYVLPNMQGMINDIT